MNRKAIIWLIAGFSLVLIGTILFGGAMTMAGWDFSKLSTEKYETNSYEIHEDFMNISILADTADISFALSQNEKSSVICYENTKVKHSVSVKDGKLFIELVDERKWYDHIGFYNRTPKITVFLPAGEYGPLSVKASTGDILIPKEFVFENIDISLSTGDLTNYASAEKGIKLRTSTGHIRVENVTTDTLDLTASTGHMTILGVTCTGDVQLRLTTGRSYVTDLACKNLTSYGSTGDISLKNAIMAGMLTLERSTGDVEFNGCDAGEISIKTDTGDVTGSLLTNKIFIAQTDTGRVSVPESVSGGKCKIITDTGNVKFVIISDD